MTSAQILAVLAFLTFGALMAALVWANIRKVAREEAANPWPSKSLHEPYMRERLRALLEHHHIVGSCDIRDGEVRVATTPGRTNSMAAALMAVYQLHYEGNPNLALFVAKRDGQLVPLALDIDDLRVIAEMLEAKT